MDLFSREITSQILLKIFFFLSRPLRSLPFDCRNPTSLLSQVVLAVFQKVGLAKSQWSVVSIILVV